MGNRLSRWKSLFLRRETISHGKKLFSTVGFPTRLASRYPSIGTSTTAPPLCSRPEGTPPMDGVSGGIPTWNFVLFPAVGNSFPPRESFATVLPYFLTLQNGVVRIYSSSTSSSPHAPPPSIPDRFCPSVPESHSSRPPYPCQILFQCA